MLSLIYVPHLIPLLKYRLDDIVIFSPLSRKQLRSIMQLQMTAISNRLKDRNIEIHLSEDGLDHVLAKAYVPEVCFGIACDLVCVR
jgi:ATP-dependent Clp protease ATP-binding subunit ClpB